MSITNDTTMRGNLNHPQMPRIPLVLEELLIEHLQIDRPPEKHTHERRKHAEHRYRPPGWRHRELLLGLDIAQHAAHCLKITTSLRRGTRICSCWRASCSIRPWADQAACSSCSIFHSLLRRSASRISSCDSANSRLD